MTLAQWGYLALSLVGIFVASVLATMAASYPGHMADRRRYGIPTESFIRYVIGSLTFKKEQGR